MTNVDRYIEQMVREQRERELEEGYARLAEPQGNGPEVDDSHRVLNQAADRHEEGESGDTARLRRQLRSELNQELGEDQIDSSHSVSDDRDDPHRSNEANDDEDDQDEEDDEDDEEEEEDEDEDESENPGERNESQLNLAEQSELEHAIQESLALVERDPSRNERIARQPAERDIPEEVKEIVPEISDGPLKDKNLPSDDGIRLI